ncbi:MAG: NAD(P)-binding domain-containing protein [Planctomycetota bacterium]
MTNPGPEPEAVGTLIVGAGPIGLELAAALKAMGEAYVQIDAGQIGATVAWYPKQATFFSSPERIAIAGVPLVTPDQSKATREGYLAYLRGVVARHELHVRTFERVESVVRLRDGFDVRTSRQGYRAERVVLAIGDMHRPRMLGVAGEDLPHVWHYFDEPHDYFRRSLLIVGGRNSAAEAALRCYHAGARVTMSCRAASLDDRGIKYWLLPELKSLIKHGRIGFLPETVVTAIEPEHAVLTPRSGGEAHRLPAQAVLLLTGYEQDPSLFESAGVELEGENRAPRVDRATMMSDVPGLYVAGTAAAGTQRRFRLFIENCHEHVVRIARSITGREPPASYVNTAVKTFGLAES